MKFVQAVRKLRRKALRLLPEFVWPTHVVLNGTKIPVRDMPFSYGIKKYLVKGEYENAERRLVDNYLHCNDRVVDMGCSIGVISAIISNKIGPNGKLVAVEASKTLAEQTADWFKKAGIKNATVLHGFAFPVTQLTQAVPAFEFQEGNGSLGGRVVPITNGSAQPATAAITLSVCQKLLGGEPTALVCDIEGAEKMIIENDTQLPASLRVIIMELHPSIYGEQIAANLVSKINNAGFSTAEKADDVYCFIRQTS